MFMSRGRRKPERPIDAAVAGHICLDIIPRFTETGIREISRLLTPGKLVQVDNAVISTGGPVSNTGIGMQIFGMNVMFMARVGDDDFGGLIIRRLKEYGSTEGISVARGENSSYSVVLAPPGIDRIFLHNPGTNDTFSSRDIDYDLLKKCRLFHLGYPPLMRSLYINGGEELVEIFRRARETGVTTSLDMSLPDPSSESGSTNWLPILEKLLPYVDIFLPSIEEAYSILKPEEFWSRREKVGAANMVDAMKPEEYSSLSQSFLDMGCRMTSLKSAHRGFYLRTGSKNSLEQMGAARPVDYEQWSDRELWAPAFSIDKIASATGSGDSAIAAFLSSFLRGYAIEKCLLLANTAGRLNLQGMDALSGLRPWDEVMQILDSGELKPVDPQIDSELWDVDDKTGVYYRLCDPSVSA